MNLASFISQAGPLPSLPAIYAELNQAIEDQYASLENIGQIIRKDQALVARLLRLSNSAYYGLPRRIETIEEALYLIGLREMCEMTLATTVLAAFPGLPPELAEAGQFWRHSLACAAGCAVLAEERQEPVPERYFVGGLLHDFGRLVLYLKAPQESLKILRRCRETGELASVVEREVLGFDHAEVGGALLELWSLPFALVEMVRCHHQPSQSRAAPGDAAVVHVADFMANALELGCSGEFTVAPLAEDGWNQCQLAVDRLEVVARTLESRYETLADILAPPEGGAKR
jgi:HD-like signal output (HDOD) protein